MKVKMQIMKNEHVLEEYTVPDGSWVQTETIGMQHIPAVTKPTEITGFPECVSRGKCTSIRFIPISPPKIPPQVASLLNSRDTRWGKNGFEWMGKNRENAGGTTLDRAREMCWALKWRTEFPLKDDPSVIEFCQTELSKRS